MSESKSPGLPDPLRGLLALPEAEQARRGVTHTAAEIARQVELWPDSARRVGERRDEILALLESARGDGPLTVVLTGAGSSEFVGQCVEGLLRRCLRLPVQTVSSARIVATPRAIFPDGYSVLLVSFARSGNSPESVGAVRLAETVCRRVYHLAVTCNAGGALAQELAGEAYRGRAAVVVLDPATDDRGLAMTASFSNLVVAGQALAHLERWADYAGFAGHPGQLPALARAGQAMLQRAPAAAQELAGLGVRRAVFLGDGANLGTAVESHLKLQELTAGGVMCAWDSFPGLRHGPEAVIDERTLIVAFLAAHPYTRRYELDLLRQLRAKGLGLRTAAVGTEPAAGDPELAGCTDLCLSAGAGTVDLPDELTPPAFVIAGQLLGLFASLALGLKPDSPSEAGVIHRVVQGIRVYDLQGFERGGRFDVLAER